MSGGRRAALAAGVTLLLWASAFVAIREVGHSFSAGPLALGRLLVASAVLSLLVAGSRRGRPALGGLGRDGWLRIGACGLLWFGLYNVALNAAERRVDAGTASMLVNVGPLVIAVLAGAFLGEGFPPRLLSGGAVAFGGVALIAAASSHGKGASVGGVLLCLVAAGGYAVAVVTQKPLLSRVPALTVTWLSCAVGTVGCLPYLPALARELPRAPARSVALVVFLGAGPTAVAFTTWAYALGRSSAGRLGTTTYLVPPLAVLLAWLTLDETPAAAALGGGLLCLAGVALSRRTGRSAEQVADDGVAHAEGGAHPEGLGEPAAGEA